MDAAQGFGKELAKLRHPRIDLISVSGHKLYAPKGVGALVARRRGFERPPLAPLTFGGGQERGLRAGTVPVHLVVGLGVAAELAQRDHARRAMKCSEIKQRMMEAFAPVDPVMNGDPTRTLPHVANLAFPGVDSEAVLVALKDQIALSNGAACTSQSYTVSHVLQAMGCSDEVTRGALRFSWCHMSQEPDWDEIARLVGGLR